MIGRDRVSSATTASHTAELRRSSTMAESQNSTIVKRSEHTPGPWTVGGITNPYSQRPYTHIWGPTPSGMQSGEWIAKDVALYNARLIAAAPDLLAALKRSVDWLASYPGEGAHPVLEQAKAAIAKALGVLLLCVALSACGITKGGNPTLPDAVTLEPAGGSGHLDLRPMSLIVGTWTGHASATQGESGDLTAIFDTAVDPTSSLNVRLIWFSNAVHLSYRGTASGTLGNLTIAADADNPPIGSKCGYHATASLNAAEDTITGAYTGTGPGVCGSKAGTFVLRRQGPPPCVGGGTFTFTKNNRLAVYPADWVFVPGRDLPGLTDVETFSIPAGTWDFSVGTQDPGHVNWATEDPLDEQTEERVTLPLYDTLVGALLHTLGPTKDVPQKETGVVVSTFPGVTLIRAIGSLKAVHWWLGRPVSKPLHSVEVKFVTYACPAGVTR